MCCTPEEQHDVVLVKNLSAWKPLYEVRCDLCGMATGWFSEEVDALAKWEEMMQEERGNDVH